MHVLVVLCAADRQGYAQTSICKPRTDAGHVVVCHNWTVFLLLNKVTSEKLEVFAAILSSLRKWRDCPLNVAGVIVADGCYLKDVLEVVFCYSNQQFKLQEKEDFTNCNQ